MFNLRFGALYVHSSKIQHGATKDFIDSLLLLNCEQSYGARVQYPLLSNRFAGITPLYKSLVRGPGFRPTVWHDGTSFYNRTND
jgi:hypothetical protein